MQVWQQDSISKFEVKKIKRDLNIIDFKGGFLVQSCDSAGGIGNLKNDLLEVPIELLAEYTLRTALMEVISVGARPLSVSAGFSNDQSYSQRAVNFLKKYLKRFKTPLVISTEKNFPTSQTGIAISVVGFAISLKIGGAHEGNKIYVAGNPEVGTEVIENKNKILGFEDFLKLRSFPDVGEIIPVGSAGISEEVKILAKNSGLDFKLNGGEWMHKSAGPSTCVIFWAENKPEFYADIKEIGYLIRKNYV